MNVAAEMEVKLIAFGQALQQVLEISLEMLGPEVLGNKLIEDLRVVAKTIRNGKVANSVNVMVVPGSGIIKE